MVKQYILQSPFAAAGLSIISYIPIDESNLDKNITVLAPIAGYDNNNIIIVCLALPREVSSAV